MTRRQFIRTSAAASIAAVAATGVKSYAAGSDKIRVGLIGCGDRGTGAASQCVFSSRGVELVAMADMFQDKIDHSLARLRTGSGGYLYKKIPDDKLKVTKDTCFLGFDAYKRLLACGVDMVILTTPPHFRPMQLRAAIEAGKHVFMEKPVAIDPVGVRSVIESAALARQKGLAIVAGTQQRRMNQYREVMRRVHHGEIGQIVAGQCYWHWGSQDWHIVDRQPGWSDMEWQLRTWPYYTWLSGDHIVEQHLHNLDIINWAIGAHPTRCMGLGGRQARTGKKYGNIFDHFAVEYEYPDGVRVASMCSQIKGTTHQVGERLVGTKGSSFTDRSQGYIEGKNAYQYDGPVISALVKEHADLIAGIRNGRVLNEGKRVAESTLTAIMGRMSAYTGRALQWDWVMNASKLELKPPKYELGGPLPVNPVAIPGQTRLV